MKKTKKIITTMLGISCSLFCSAQQTHHHTSQSQWIAQHKKEASTTEYIFEGTLIAQYTQNTSIVTCSVIQINKIFKGNPKIKLGTIKVLTEQSRSMKDGWKGLFKGSTYIILGRLGDTNTFHSIKSDNHLILWCEDCIYCLGKDGARWGGTAYSTVDSVYSFFKENGVTVQEEQK